MNQLSRRNSNIEVLRIVAMLLIVLSHYTVHSGIVSAELPLGFSRFLFEAGGLGNIGVILFILITGYYSIGKSDPFKLKRLMSLIFQVLFYSLAIYLIFCIFGIEDFSIGNFMKNMLPITFKQYWFVTAFAALYILAPYINALLYNIDRKQHLQLIIIALTLFSIIPTFTTQTFYGNELVQFVMLYSIGAYLGKYKDSFFSKRKNAWLVLIGCGAMILLSIVAFDLLSTHWPIFSKYSKHLLNRNSIASILFSVSVFSLFIKKKPFTNNLINVIASCAFGVYLISDNNYIRGVLWTNILNVSSFASSPILFLHIIGSVIAVYLVCTIIELIRLNTLERLFSLIYDRTKKRVEKRMVVWQKR